MSPAVLLERGSQLAELAAAWGSVESGEGRLLLIGGEAGVGKSSLVRHFASAGPPERVLFGACDPLEIPAPLGPLLEMAGGLGPEVGELLAAPAPGGRLLVALADELRRSTRLVVVEDVHWADQATLDALRYLGRRVTQLRVLLLVTFRTEEMTSLSGRGLLGDVAGLPGVSRMQLEPLSPAATRTLAGDGADAALLHERTGGNPFFITQVLAAGRDAVPATVRDAVLARVLRLSNAARSALEAAAAAGTRIPRARLLAVLDRTGTPRWALDEAVRAGLLVVQDETVRFRHDLVRSAVEDAIAPSSHQALHATLLDLLREEVPGPNDGAALVAHAEAAGDVAALREMAPAAAARAAALSAHREAAALYGKALSVSTERAERARLAEDGAHQLYLAGRLQEALARHRQAAQLCEREGDARAEARNLSRVAALSFLVGEYEGVEPAADAAVACLAALPPGKELAMVYETRSRLRFMASDPAGAQRWGERAHLLARRLGQGDFTIETAVTLGAARLLGGDAEGEAMLHHALGDARGRRLEDTAARAILYLAWLPVLERRYEGVDRHLDEGLRYAEENELSYWRDLLVAARVRQRTDLGRWREAEEDAVALLRADRPVMVAISQVLIAIGIVRARQGRADEDRCLERAETLAGAHPEVDAVSPVAPALVERAVLSGETARALEIARRSLHADRGVWELGALWFWARQVGAALNVPRPLPKPYSLLSAGDWRGAVAWWEERGCPYEAAMSRALSDDVTALLEAAGGLDMLDARAAAALVRRRLRALGMASIPRGPRAFARSNPAHLTRREHEVLSLIAERLGNDAIASRLFLSPKTVERHVSAILRKLDVDRRLDAVEVARRVGALLPRQDEGAPAEM